MKKLAKNKSLNLKDIFDSDDELPTEYIELSFVPAYQNDNRFEYIEEQKKINEKLSNKQRKEGYSETVALGYLNKKDMFCFQCLESTTGDKTLLWFLNFLMIKDLHSSFTFLTTCLVPKIYVIDSCNATSKSAEHCDKKSQRYKIVARK